MASLLQRRRSFADRPGRAKKMAWWATGDVAVYGRMALRFLALAFIYLLLIDISFVFLYPVFYMFATSLKTAQDLVDPTVYWIPTEVSRTIQTGLPVPFFDKFVDNYYYAWDGLNFLRSSLNSIYISVFSAIGQTISCAFVAYGLARIRFPGRELIFLLVLLTFLVPPETIIVPLFITYKNFGWISTYWPFIVPSFFGHGLKGALFVIIFRQFFKGLPWELEDAAYVDGANALRTFFSVMLPLAKPAIFVVFLFSLVWHWNDYFEPAIYLTRVADHTLPMRLQSLRATLDSEISGGSGDIYNEALIMAACVLIILPPLLIYALMQRYFTESVDRTGLVE